MAWPLFPRAILAGLCLAGCAAIAGVGDGDTIVESPGAGDGAAEAGASEGGITGDGAACAPRRITSINGVISAKRAVVTPKVDGDLGEWACVDRIDVGQGAIQLGMPGGTPQSVEFAFQWTETDIWFYAHAVTAQPGYDNANAALYANDSVHLVIGAGDVRAGGAYRANDHQITFDHDGRFADYRSGTWVSTTKIDARVVAKKGSAAIDFQVEARLPASLLGVADFASGRKLLVNVQLVDGKGGDGVGVRVWRTPACGCQTGGCCNALGTVDSPTCNMKCTEVLQLD